MVLTVECNSTVSPTRGVDLEDLDQLAFTHSELGVVGSVVLHHTYHHIISFVLRLALLLRGSGQSFSQLCLLSFPGSSFTSHVFCFSCSLKRFSRRCFSCYGLPGRNFSCCCFPCCCFPCCRLSGRCFSCCHFPCNHLGLFLSQPLRLHSGFLPLGRCGSSQGCLSLCVDCGRHRQTHTPQCIGPQIVANRYQQIGGKPPPWPCRVLEIGAV
mmetsp:Transcript_35991/g.86665  ORF Transcript_35991/g.86665 Transcript_35991/m.86665 type:complete len:212 (+) Transcript_35991:160-795(+)